jgi:hypothetical protein
MGNGRQQTARLAQKNCRPDRKSAKVKTLSPTGIKKRTEEKTLLKRAFFRPILLEAFVQRPVKASCR